MSLRQMAAQAPLSRRGCHCTVKTGYRRTQFRVFYGIEERQIELGRHRFPLGRGGQTAPCYS